MAAEEKEITFYTDDKGRALCRLLNDPSATLARRLGTAIPPAELDKWRRRGTNSNTAWDRYAQVLNLERADASPSDRERILRQILTDEPSFRSARSSLAEILVSTGRAAEAELEVRGLVSEDPDICSSHLMLAWHCRQSDKQPESER